MSIIKKYLHMGTGRMKEDKETEKDGKQKREKSKELKWVQNKEVPIINWAFCPVTYCSI